MTRKLALARWLRSALLILLGLAAGAAVAVARTEFYDPEQRFGAWTGNLRIAEEGESLAERAYRARHQLFALTSSEAVYFYLRRDERGRRLNSDCDYRLRGPAPPGRWWSLTAYDPDGYLIPDRFARHSYMPSVGRASRAPLDVVVSGSAEADPDAIVTAGGGDYYLILRIYQPSPVAKAAWAERLPQVVTTSCRKVVG